MRQGVGERLLDGAAARAEAKRVRDRRGNQAGVGKMREIDEDGAAALVRRESTCYLRREPRLANAAGPGQRQQPRTSGSQQVGRLVQFALTPEQRCRRGGSSTPRLAALAARLSSCTRIARSSAWSAGPGSIPISSTSVRRMARYSASASDWRPAL